MMNRQLALRLDEVAARVKRVRRLHRLAVCWTAAATALIALMLLPLAGGPRWAHAGPLIALLAGCAAAAVFLLTRVDRRSIAATVERKFPTLDARLITAIEQRPDPITGRFRPLQRQLIDEAVEHSCREDWRGCIPAVRFRRASTLHTASILLFGAAFAGLHFMDWHWSRIGEGRLGQGNGLLVAPDGGPMIDPGDTSVERGRSLLVLARFKRDLPAEMALVYSEPDGGTQSIPMAKSLNDPVFGARVPHVERPLQYHVEFNRYRSRDFDVTVFDYPALEQADATIHYPEYTSLPDRLIEDTRQVSAVEGSVITLTCRMNKPVALARLVAADESTVELQALGDERPIYEGRLSPKTKQRYKLQLVDAEGRHNQAEAEFLINILPNRRPELQLAFPGRDLKVSPIEEVSLKASAWDDFGVESYGVVYGMADRDTKEIALGSHSPRQEKLDLSHVLSFESLNAEPGQLVSYYFYADDFGPDGKLRRTFTDMFFAEVRHFDEIFRQGNQPPGGQSPSEMNEQGQAQQVDQLLELQKQIINATWNLVRRNASSVPSDAFRDDAAVIKESQESALSQVAEVRENVSDPTSQQLVEDVARHMTRAVNRLEEAVGRTTPEPLHDALGAEQSAYQALLALQSREHEVIRGQPGTAGAAASGGRAQQQLQQLELKSDENRYETERTAANRQAESARSEQLQIVNRLRELARRQQGLNQLYKELQNALREARDEQEKEEIQRRLKRLREQQNELVRDLDELRNRMEQPENAQQTTAEREQLERTRSNVRRASEALEEGRVSKALASGTRAERELQDLHNEFRQKTAGRFADEMRELRDSARELSQREQQLADKLESVGQHERQTLRKSQDREDVERSLTDQQSQLKDVLDRMRRITEDSQETEPLLAKRLYETIRESRESNPQDFLDTTRQLLANGLLDEAIETEKVARQGIEAVRRGVEQAAESVIGNEADALKRARQELEDLTKAVASERPPTDPSRESNDDSGSRADSKPQDGHQPSRPGSAGPRRSEREANEQRNASSAAGQRAESNDRLASDSPRQTESQRGAAERGSPSSTPSEASQTGSRSEESSEAAGLSGRGGEPRPRTGLPSRDGLAGRGLIESFLNRTTSAGAPGGPLTGSEYQEWSDRMREVEELVEDPELQGQIANIRDSARGMRVEFKRHSKEPNWDLVNQLILQPMVDLQHRLDEEISKRESKDALVPIDRDPVPKRYEELVRRYYQRLGSGK